MESFGYGMIARKLGLVALVLCPAMAFAADPVPNIKGKWVGKTHTIVAGSGGHWPTSKGTFEKPALFERDITIEIVGQEGRRFWGVTTISGDGENTGEPLIGVLTGRDNRKFAIADTDGYFSGELAGDDALSFCYMQAGGKTAGAAVVSCTELKRAR